MSLSRVKTNKKKTNITRKKIGEINNDSKINKYINIKIISYILLLAIFLFSFYIRGITPVENVLNRGVVGFAMDDSVFQMRLVENTIHFFPHRIFYDAFTLFPNGNSLHWGPLFSQLIAFFALVAGFITNGSMPDKQTIDMVGVFFPAVLGALIVFPVFFIGKELKDVKAGLLGAFLISIMPGLFLHRSVLGFTDHHIAEVFFTTLMMMFFIMAIKRAENITFDHWLNRDWGALKSPLIYSLLAGLSFGAFLLTWTYGVFFAVLFGVFIIVQYIIDHFKGKSTEYLGIVGIVAYIVAMIAVLPYFESSNGFAPDRYSVLHLIVTGGFAALFAFLSLVSREMNKRQYSGFYYLLFVAGTILIGLLAISVITPALYQVTVGNFNVVFKGTEGGSATVGETHPTSFEVALAYFGYNYLLSYMAIFLLGYYIIKKSRAEYTLVVVWSVLVLAILLAQSRFAYYYAVNISILSGLICSRLLDFADWRNFDSSDIIECLKRIRVQHVLSLVIVIAVIGFLPSDRSPYRITMNQAPWGAMSPGYYEWYDTLTWMKDNTPAPDLPYYSIYKKPTPGEKYNYSANDYGVMSWWDYGH
ncbi:MAG TPA: oligosaccharyl transferase, archaeosortase A system-associated, partial [Candidatus Methylomirabilis sp.]|nr:oligosaccharyl transferase, archaeosortase A system-associated [Candidatus Methylomirabilis sp.]